MTGSYLNPPAVGRLLNIKPAKVLAWVKSGQLSAVNVAERPGGRPRWRISRDSLDLFLATRANRAPVKAVRRRRAVEVQEFFA
jgi:hypothetical protein